MSARRWDHHPPCPGGCGELADECMTPGCGSPLGSMRVSPNPTRHTLDCPGRFVDALPGSCGCHVDNT